MGRPVHAGVPAAVPVSAGPRRSPCWVRFMLPASPGGHLTCKGYRAELLGPRKVPLPQGCMDATRLAVPWLQPPSEPQQRPHRAQHLWVPLDITLWPPGPGSLRTQRGQRTDSLLGPRRGVLCGKGASDRGSQSQDGPRRTRQGTDTTDGAVLPGHPAPPKGVKAGGSPARRSPIQHFPPPTRQSREKAQMNLTSTTFTCGPPAGGREACLPVCVPCPYKTRNQCFLTDH